MKQAYLSVVLPILSSAEIPDTSRLRQLDLNLTKLARSHEIVICVPFNLKTASQEVDSINGPITFLYTNPLVKKDELIVCGLGRAVGDLVIEWHESIELLTEEILTKFIDPTDFGFELVEAVPIQTSRLSSYFYRFANVLRPSYSPIRKIVGRSYSRKVLSQLLARITFEPQLNVLFAEIPISRDKFLLRLKPTNYLSILERIREGISLLVKGTKFGSVIPLVMAGISASFAVSAGVYALVVYLVRGKTPAGWTTLMIVTGFGQAAILALLGLVWSRIDYLTRGLSRKTDNTAEVIVHPSIS